MDLVFGRACLHALMFYVTLVGLRKQPESGQRQKESSGIGTEGFLRENASWLFSSVLVLSVSFFSSYSRSQRSDGLIGC